MSAISRWRAAYDVLESDCPWPGPRPLDDSKDAEHRWRFVGRTDDVGDFVQAVDEFELVVLHGQSGSGKSSLLDMGLVPALLDTGYVPLVLRDWRGIEEGSPDGFLKKMLKDAEIDPAVAKLITQDTPPVAALDQALGRRAVLILDQFEELIRYQRQSFYEVAQWILAVNKRTRIHVVISLRSEYLFELGGLIDAARPFSATYLGMGPLSDPGDIRAIIEGPNTAGMDAIDDGAVGAIFENWMSLDADSPDRSLLSLHAALFALYWMARSAGRTRVTSSDVQELESMAQPLDGRFFTAGFDRAIELKLDLCAQACEDVSETVRAPLIDNVREYIRRSANHLSSGGFKLQRDMWDLYRLTCDREVELLATDSLPVDGNGVADADGRMHGDVLRAVVRAVARQPADWDLLSASRTEFLGLADVKAPAFDHDDHDAALAALGVEPPPWRADPRDLTAGVMLGLPPWEALLEHTRAFAFALSWLTAASMIRVSSPRGDTHATLIHDGFGAALSGWSLRRGFRPEVAVTSVTAFQGEQWNWDQSDMFRSSDDWKHLVNLRWRYCEVTATFRRVVFVNCDLRGARFKGCTFEGVTFVNCLLDGASIEECQIVGQAPAHDPHRPAYLADERVDAQRDDRQRGEVAADRLPEFLVPVPDAVVDDFRVYRAAGGGASQSRTVPLYSPTSGVAAIPWKGKVPTAVDWEHGDGGLCMYGGRLSSLMIRGCDFTAGSMTLAHVAGSSLDIVEQKGISLTLSWSVVRGLSVSAPVTADALDSGGNVSVTATESVLTDTWLGAGLVGSVQCHDCKVFALTSISAPDAMRVAITNSKYAHLFNADVPDEGQPMGSMVLGTGRRDSAETTVMLGVNSLRMAYRSRPAEVELVRRAEAMAAPKGAADS